MAPIRRANTNTNRRSRRHDPLRADAAFADAFDEAQQDHLGHESDVNVEDELPPSSTSTKSSIWSSPIDGDRRCRPIRPIPALLVWIRPGVPRGGGTRRVSNGRWGCLWWWMFWWIFGRLRGLIFRTYYCICCNVMVLWCDGGSNWE
jgi:hypothetical protein